LLRVLVHARCYRYGIAQVGCQVALVKVHGDIGEGKGIAVGIGAAVIRGVAGRIRAIAVGIGVAGAGQTAASFTTAV
jgi:hypothetical protein